MRKARVGGTRTPGAAIPPCDIATPKGGAIAGHEPPPCATRDPAPTTAAEALALVEHHFRNRSQGALRQIDPQIHMALQLLGALAAIDWGDPRLRKASGYDLYRERPDVVRQKFATVYELVQWARATSGDA